MAEDVLQNSYLKLFDGSAQYSGRSGVRAFFFSVIRRTASEERRRRIVRATLSLSVLHGERAEAAETQSGLVPIIHDETSLQLHAALDRLSTRQREVLHLVFYQELTIAAAAEIIGVSLGSARTHYERGKAQLRQLLEEQEQHDQ